MILETYVGTPLLVEKFVKFICDEYDIRPKKISICNMDKNKDSVLGLCLDTSEDEFIILVKEEGRNIGQIFNTIAHEMIHVKQYVKENLGWFLDNRGHIPYIERWWEVEAFRNSAALVEKFAKTISHEVHH